ncbi:hypothetical protein Tcan_11796 [Toxocara canis]|uniref:Uncharacterized protein n=1 Tax=Toxocara canis TaxID=6265 RepID=A0A0B2VDZ7_TOXCA|nr:hypothetical protein Tcan_11796 [Toxocara canis]
MPGSHKENSSVEVINSDKWPYFKWEILFVGILMSVSLIVLIVVASLKFQIDVDNEHDRIDQTFIYVRFNNRTLIETSLQRLSLPEGTQYAVDSPDSEILSTVNNYTMQNTFVTIPFRVGVDASSTHESSHETGTGIGTPAPLQSTYATVRTSAIEARLSVVSTTIPGSTTQTGLPAASTTVLKSTTETGLPAASTIVLKSTTETGLPATSTIVLKSTTETGLPATSTTVLKSTKETGVPALPTTIPKSTTEIGLPAASTNILKTTKGIDLQATSTTTAKPTIKNETTATTVLAKTTMTISMINKQMSTPQNAVTVPEAT